jgi:hypothetical protein
VRQGGPDKLDFIPAWVAGGYPNEYFFFNNEALKQQQGAINIYPIGRLMAAWDTDPEA